MTEHLQSRGFQAHSIGRLQKTIWPFPRYPFPLATDHCPRGVIIRSVMTSLREFQSTVHISSRKRGSSSFHLQCGAIHLMAIGSNCKALVVMVHITILNVSRDPLLKSQGFGIRSSSGRNGQFFPNLPPGNSIPYWLAPLEFHSVHRHGIISGPFTGLPPLLCYETITSMNSTELF